MKRKLKLQAILDELDAVNKDGHLNTTCKNLRDIIVNWGDEDEGNTDDSGSNPPGGPGTPTPPGTGGH